jgi:hypothetical protein
MNVREIKERVMYQTNNDADDVGDFSPHLLGYINDGYDQILFDALGVHVGDTDYPLLSSDADTPVSGVPAWTHSAIADYATYCVYMNGSAPKQSRGYAYLARFNKVKSRLSVANTPAITNIPM